LILSFPAGGRNAAAAAASSHLRRAARPSSPLRRTARPSSHLRRRATARPSTPLQRAARPRRLPHGGGQPLGRARLYGGLPGPAGRGSPLRRDALQSQIARSNKMQHASIVQGGDDQRGGAPQRNRALQVEHQYFGMLLITTNRYASANQTFASGAPKVFALLVLDMNTTDHSMLTGYCNPTMLILHRIGPGE
jgi:hypothetical protein